MARRERLICNGMTAKNRLSGPKCRACDLLLLQRGNTLPAALACSAPRIGKGMGNLALGHETRAAFAVPFIIWTTPVTGRKISAATTAPPADKGLFQVNEKSQPFDISI